MYLQKLSIFNYKNIQEANIEFSPRLNCFFGKNGVGKTNFLDAIHYLSFCKSHTNPVDSQNIFHEADYFMLQGSYLIEGKEEEYYCAMKRRQKKTFKFNKKEYERLSDHIGRLPLVIVSPADENLIREGSDERRRFMDIALSQFDHSYMEALMSYNKALYQRNALLKNEQMNREDSLYEMYDASMNDYAGLIYQKRREFITAFQPVFERYYQAVSGLGESIGLHYISHLEQGNLQEQLFRSREKDIILGFTTKGIHKDELEMQIDGYPIKRVGSQGQNKSYLIALKLAQYEYLKQAGRKKPILLLDDLFDKLDASRVERIIQLVSKEDFGQIFITDTHREHLNMILQANGKDFRVFHIENACICPTE